MSPLILFGSARRNGNTGMLVDALAEELGAEVVDLSNLRLSGYDYEHRNRDDDFEPLMGKVLKHRQIVFASPIYWYSCAPPMKVFLDRISDYLDLPELLDLGRRLRGIEAYVACTSVRDEPSEHFLGAFRDTFEYLGMRFKGAVHINCVDGYQRAQHDTIVSEFAKTLKVNAV